MHIELKNIKKSFITNKKKGERVEVLKDISCAFEGHKIYFLTGPSGSGKSTLLSIIGNLDKPTEGEILFDGKKVEDRQSFIRDNISFVFQEYNLFENMTVYENLSLYQKDKKIIKELLEQFNCSFSLNTKVKYLSGGERQRLSILRSYIKGGEIFLMDEPTGNLDENNSRQVMELVTSIAKDKLIIVVSHNLELANEYGDIIYSLKDGKLDKMEKASTTLTIDLKNDTNKAFNPIIEKLLILGSINLTIEGKEEVWNKDDYLDKIKSLRNKYKDKKVNIIITSDTSEKKQFIISKKEDNKSFFLMHYGIKNIANKMGRTVFSFISLILSLFLMFSAFNFTFYDAPYYINNILVQKEVYMSPTNILHGTQYFNGVELHHIVSNDDNYFPLGDFVRLRSEDESISDISINIFVARNETVKYANEIYTIPEDEILLLDYVATFNERYLNSDTITIRDLNDVQHDIKVSSTTIKTNKMLDNNLGYGYMSYDYFLSLNDKSVPIEVYAPQKIGDYIVDEDAPQTFKKTYENQNLISGRPIANDDEIIVSTDFILNFMNLGATEQNVLNEKYEIAPYSSFPSDIRFDIEHPQFDLNELFDEVTIVGVSDDTSADIYLSSAPFDILFAQNLYADSPYINTADSYDKISYLFDNDVQINDNNVRSVYSIVMLFGGSSGLFIMFIGVLFIIVASIILLTWIISIIKDRYREIAIMKCLGLKTKNIYLSFLSIITFITLISVATAMILGAALTPLINTFITYAITSTSMDVGTLLFSANAYSYLILLGVAIIYPALISLTFIKRLDKVEPFGALKEFR